MKTTIVLGQGNPAIGDMSYIVESTTNRREPAIGESLRPDEVDALLEQAAKGGDLTVKIRPRR